MYPMKPYHENIDIDNQSTSMYKMQPCFEDPFKSKSVVQGQQPTSGLPTVS